MCAACIKIGDWIDSWTKSSYRLALSLLLLRLDSCDPGVWIVKVFTWICEGVKWISQNGCVEVEVWLRVVDWLKELNKVLKTQCLAKAKAWVCCAFGNVSSFLRTESLMILIAQYKHYAFFFSLFGRLLNYKYFGTCFYAMGSKDFLSSLLLRWLWFEASPATVVVVVVVDEERSS